MTDLNAPFELQPLLFGQLHIEVSVHEMHVDTLVTVSVFQGLWGKKVETFFEKELETAENPSLFLDVDLIVLVFRESFEGPSQLLSALLLHCLLVML